MNRAGAFAVTAFGLCVTAGAAPAHRPLMIWNATASAPLGLWRLSRPGGLQVGEWVAVRPSADTAAWLARAHYLPSGALLVKRVAATAGQSVCRRGLLVTIDERTAARARPVGRRRERLPAWSGCRRLAGGEVFLLNPAEGSLDGRYLGVTGAAQLVGRAQPVLIWNGR